MLILNNNNSTSLNYLNNFVNLFNNLDDLTVNELIVDFKNHPFNNEKVDFFTELENKFSSIESEFKNNIMNFLNKYSELKIDDFEDINDLRSNFESTKIYQFLNKFSKSTHPNNSNGINKFIAELELLKKEVCPNSKNPKALTLKVDFLDKFKTSLEDLIKENLWGYRSNIIINNVYNSNKGLLNLLNDINYFVKAINQTSNQSFDYKIYYNPKLNELSFLKNLDYLEIGTISIGFDSGKVSNFQKDWKNKQTDLKKVLKKNLKNFLSRKYKFIVSTISSKTLKMSHIKENKIPLCLITEEELEENLKHEFTFLSIYDVTKLFMHNSIDEVDKILNLIKKLSLEANELVKVNERILHKWN